MSNDRSTKPKRSNNSTVAAIDKREMILTEAVRLFYELGYEKTSIRDIAKNAGVANSALYYYFTSKQEMLFAIIDRQMDKVFRYLKDLESIENKEEKLRAIIANHVKIILESPIESQVLVWEIRSLEGEYRATEVDKERRYFEIAREIVGDIAKQRNAKIDLDVAVYSFFGVLNWIHLWYKPDGRISPEELPYVICQIILSGLGGCQGEALSSCGK
jgi:TetR/AcrR family transcriptional regulator, cholesterol catabolism regulator